MNTESKKAVQGAFFDLMIAMDPTVGEMIEVGMGVAFMALMQHHRGDTQAAGDGLQECVRQMLEQLPKVQRAPMGLVLGGKLDS